MDILKEFDQFVDDYVSTDKVELYNESGLQFEFSYYLKSKLPESRIFIERNVSKLGLNKQELSLYKSECDLLIDDQVVVEFKFPRNGAYPKRMSQAIEDIGFLEQLKHIDQFTGLAIFFTDDFKFFDPHQREKNGLYRQFRIDRTISSATPDEIKNYLGNKIREVSMKATYPFELKSVMNHGVKFHYYRIII